MKKIKIVITGIGNRALPKNNKNYWHGWIRQIKSSKKFILLAAHDISERSLEKILKKRLLKKNKIYKNFVKMLEKEKPEAVLISSPAKSHFKYIEISLKYNLYVLVEKPMVLNLNQAKKLKLNKNKNKIVVIQNWRTKPVGLALKKFIRSGKLGHVGQIFFRYIRNRENASYSRYIFKEKLPSLYAMGIHHLDLFRYLLSDDITKINGNFYRPAWSKYSSPTSFNLNLLTKKNTFINYTSTFSSLSNMHKQESLIINGSKGTITNDSNWLEPPLYFKKKNSEKKYDLTKNIKKKNIASQYNFSDAFILDNFYDCVIKKKNPICSFEDAFKTIKLLEYCEKVYLKKNYLKVLLN